MRVLSAASVIGRSFSFLLLDSVLEGMDSEDLFDAIEEDQHMGLITSSTEGPEAPLTFCHELVRQTLLTGLTQPRRQRWHLKIAEAMEKIHGARSADRVTEIAHHLVKGGAYAESSKVSHYLGLAGEGALRTGAYENARRSFQDALAYQQDKPATRAALLSHLAAAERSLGD
jgi:predicted ATPase